MRTHKQALTPVLLAALVLCFRVLAWCAVGELRETEIQVHTTRNTSSRTPHLLPLPPRTLHIHIHILPTHFLHTMLTPRTSTRASPSRSFSMEPS